MTALFRISGNILLIAMLSMLATCKVASSQAQEGSSDKRITDRLGNDVIVESSERGTYRLYKQSPGGHVGRVYKYVVIRSSDQSIVSEGTYKMGHVKWKDDSTLEVMTSEEQNRGAEPTKKFINLNINSN